MFETLETRRLLSAAAASFSDGGTAALASNGTLTVKTASALGNIQVIEDHGSVMVLNLQTNQEADFTGVTAITINGNSGNDTIFYQGNTIGANVNGNSGADSLTILDLGNASSVADGGADNDEINLVYSHNATLLGGSGDDVIAINTAAGAGYTVYDYTQSDTIVDAGSGNDTIVTYAGNSTINGGSGNDTLLFYGGNNTLSKVEVTVIE